MKRDTLKGMLIGLMICAVSFTLGATAAKYIIPVDAYLEADCYLTGFLDAAGGIMVAAEENTGADTLDAMNEILWVDTTSGGHTLTLPDANTVLGKRYIIVLITDGGDLLVDVASGDGLDSSANTRATFADAEDTLVFYAVSANRWLVTVNIGAVAFSTP